MGHTMASCGWKPIHTSINCITPIEFQRHPGTPIPMKKIDQNDALEALLCAAVNYGLAARNPGTSFQEYAERVAEQHNILTQAAIQYAFTHGTAQ